VGEHLEGSCCAAGDPLIPIASGHAAEVVDVEADDRHAVLCGGFGANVHDVSNPEAPQSLGSVSARCQHAALGPDGNAGRLFFLTHHGDSWVKTPFLASYVVGKLNPLDSLSEPGVLYEAPEYQDGHLYVAAHGGGARIYSVDADSGKLAHLATTGEGLGNINFWRVLPNGQVAYALDNAAAALRVISIAEPAKPKVLTTISTTGPPRDAAIDGDRLYVALGGFGVDVFDLSDPGTPALVDNIDTLGSAQAVSSDGGAVAVAGWNHVALYDSASFALVATERTRAYPAFEQDLGVAMVDDVLHVGEWTSLYSFRYRQGFVAADLWIDEKLFQFDPEQKDARSVVVRNRGHLPLHVSSIKVNEPAYSVSTTALDIAPRAADSFEVLYQPPAALNHAELTLLSDDPSKPAMTLGLVASNSGLIDVGDPLTDKFGFLDPNNSGNVEGLKGNVVVLAYFALF